MKSKITASVVGLLSLFVAVILSSCSDDDNSATIPANAAYEIVTFEEQTSAGSVFTLLRSNGLAPLTLIAARQPLNPELFTEGERMLIAYVADNGDYQSSGNITLYGGALINNGAAEMKTAEETDNFASNAVRLRSAYLTDNYLNFDLLLDCTVKPALFTVYIDEATLDSESPMVYLIVKSDDFGSSYWQQYYGSFSINDLIASGAEQFTLTVVDDQRLGGIYTETFKIY